MNTLKLHEQRVQILIYRLLARLTDCIERFDKALADNPPNAPSDQIKPPEPPQVCRTSRMISVYLVDYGANLAHVVTLSEN